MDDLGNNKRPVDWLNKNECKAGFNKILKSALSHYPIYNLSKKHMEIKPISYQYTNNF
jgi:hypothetical protein